MAHIDEYRFGYFIVDGKEYDYDIRIINNIVDKWQNHSLSLEDVKPVIAAKPTTIIIGTGSSGVVQVSDEIKNAITQAGIKLIVEKSREACRIFNELNKKEKVAAVLHSTC